MWKITENRHRRQSDCLERRIGEKGLCRCCLWIGGESNRWIYEWNSVCAIEQGISYDDFEQIQQLQLSYQLGQLRQNTEVVDRHFTAIFYISHYGRRLVLSGFYFWAGGIPSREYILFSSELGRFLRVVDELLKRILTEVQSRPIRFYFRRCDFLD